MSLHFFTFSFFVAPALLLGTLFLGARIQKIVLWSWGWTLSPFYIVLFASLFLIIVEYRRRVFRGNVSGVRGMLFLNFAIWLFVGAFLWLLSSKLDHMEDSYPWKIVFAPAIAMAGISTTFEFTGLFIEQMTRYSVLFGRTTKVHIVVWTLVYLSLLLFFALLAQKLDALPQGASWCLVFVPLDFFLFFFLLVILLAKLGRRDDAPSGLTIFASSLFVFAMTVFVIIVQSALCVGNKIDAFLALSPFIAAFGLITCATLYFRRKYKSSDGGGGGGEEGEVLTNLDV